MYCYCCCSPSDATSSSTTTTTTTTTNESVSDNQSKPWLSRMFTSGGEKSADNINQQQTADFNAIKHFDLKNVRQDFNRPAGNVAAPGVRVSKTGRKIR